MGLVPSAKTFLAMHSWQSQAPKAGRNCMPEMARAVPVFRRRHGDAWHFERFADARVNLSVFYFGVAFGTNVNSGTQLADYLRLILSM